jgi:hypothetical protein
MMVSKLATRQELIHELSQVRAGVEQVKKMSKELAMRTSQLYRKIETISEPPAKGVPNMREL